MRIGIVGTGIAGLTAGWLFRRAGSHITLFEHHPALGMDAHSIPFGLENADGRIDVPSRMFNSSLWPNLFRLYQELGVETESVDPSKTFGTVGNPATLKFGKSYQPKLNPNLLSFAVRRIHQDIGRMMKQAPVDVAEGIDLTMEQYLTQNQYSNDFIFGFLFPALSSTVCTCSYESLLAFPAATLLRRC